jgi:hypothetical protein
VASQCFATLSAAVAELAPRPWRGGVELEGVEQFPARAPAAVVAEGLHDL